MPEQKNGSNKPLARALAIITLMAGYTGLFVPVRQYVERQDGLETEVKDLSNRLTRIETRMEDTASRLSRIETRLEAFQTWPQPINK